MKKMKRFATLALTGAMVLGMSATAFAAPDSSATITVNEVNGADLSFVQVIEPNTRTATGWDLVDDVAGCYTSAFGLTGADATAAEIAAAEQSAIAMMIKSMPGYTDADLPAALEGVTAATATQIDTALNNVMNTASFTAMANPQTVDEAGVYAIHAVGPNYTYEVMSAYIGFGGVDTDGNTYEYPSLMNAELTTKKIPTSITKADNDENDAVYIDQTVTYTLETAFPYFKANATDKTFSISDEITGAHYVNLVGDGKTASVTIGGETVAADFVQNGNTFSVDLSSYVDATNSKAGKTVVVTYQAVVDEVEVENQAASHVGGAEYDSNEINLYSGEITLLKYDAADKATVLAGAKFEVKDAEGNVLSFVYDAQNNVYTYDIEDTEGAVTEITTGADGKVKVEGLDLGTYTFVEVEAPTGYSINENPVTAELAIDGSTATAVFSDSVEMSDTKLVALPGTGGVGTTMFTIGGVVIIVAAAGLLAANRKKAAR